MMLRKGDHSVIVSPQGGSILQWQYKDKFILGPTRIVEVGGVLKKRGETHWCYPNFGSVKPEIVPEFQQPQHGHLRTTKFKYEMGDDETSAFFYHCDDVIATRVEVSELGISATLEVANSRPKHFPVLPALHPYFAVPKNGLNVMIVGGDKTISNKDVLGNDHSTEERTQSCDGQIVVELNGIGRVIMYIVEAHDDQSVVVWSDSSAEYVCVEPVFGEPGTYATSKCDWIPPGASRKYEIQFRFLPN